MRRIIAVFEFHIIVNEDHIIESSLEPELWVEADRAQRNSEPDWIFFTVQKSTQGESWACSHP